MKLVDVYRQKLLTVGIKIYNQYNELLYEIDSFNDYGIVVKVLIKNWFFGQKSENFDTIFYSSLSDCEYIVSDYDYKKLMFNKQTKDLLNE